MPITKEFLNQTGAGFCLAKWTQATIHLGVGLTHSCHHTQAHQIDSEAIEKDPSALHNTHKKCSDREAMRAGNRLPDCNYCWRVEDANAGVSDRIRKSSAPWSTVDADSIVNGDWETTVKFPRSLEVSFSNVCNFACAYCGPTFSSKWHAEITDKGPYKIGSKFYNNLSVEQTPNREYNPYIDAFWKWFPNIVNGLHEFRITGGEPLMSKETFRILEMISNGDYRNLNFAVNTNGQPPDESWTRFCKLLEQIDNQKSCKSVTVYPSAEATGLDAEYIRDGLDWNKFKHNIEMLLKATKRVKVSFMSTITILSLPTLAEFSKWIVELKKQYGADRVKADITQLKHPQFLDVANFPSDHNNKIFDAAIDIFDGYHYEQEKLAIIKKVVESKTSDHSHQTQLKEFLQQYDIRRNKDANSLFDFLENQIVYQQ